MFFTQAHKEERFLFPIYPLIALSAALTLYGIERLLMHMTDNTMLSCGFSVAITVFFALLSASRIVSMYRLVATFAPRTPSKTELLQKLPCAL